MNGESINARALIDQGSEISLVSEHLVQLLRLLRSHSSISLIGIGGKRSNQTKGLTQLILRSHFDVTSELSVSAHILPKLTTSLPSVKVQKKDWPHLNGLILADYNYTTPGPIDIILGADVYSQIIEDGIVKGEVNSPIAQRTKFGWIISGPSDITASSNSIQGYHISIDKELHNLLQQFWTLEEIPSSKKSLSTDDQKCEQHFQSTHTRDHKGRLS